MRSYFESKLDSVRKWPIIARVSLGILLIVGGVLGFFPVLGFWMVPLGLVILATDFRWARHALVNLRLRLRGLRRRFYPKRSSGVSDAGGD